MPMLRKLCSSIFIAFSVTPFFVLQGFSGSTGLAAGTTFLFGTQNSYTTPSLGFEIHQRYPIGEKGLGWGFNLGAELFLPTAQSNNSLTALVALPLQVNAHWSLLPGNFIFRPGLGVGPYLSVIVSSNRTGLGITAWAQPQIEIGFKLSGGGELLLIPAYNAIFEFLNPGGSYVHGLSLRAAIRFAPPENKKTK